MATTATFDFPLHMVEDKNTDPGNRVQLGNSYMFATPPTAPTPRVFVLSFETMWRGLKADGTMDTTTLAQTNAGALWAFYQTYQLHKTFQYQHPWFGAVNVRFNKPLELPKGRKGADGWTEAFSIELIEQP
jgi:hypothetical protein